jgi:hypothetical protein
MMRLATWLLASLLLAAWKPAGAVGIDQAFEGRAKSPEWVQQFRSLFGEGRSYAVVIGISEYTGASHDNFDRLRTANDAQRMRQFLLDKAGFDYVYVLTEEKATKKRITQLMEDEMPARVGPNDRFLFYWSGHGISRTLPSGNDRQLGYLPLIESRRSAYSSMISMSDIRRWDDYLQARQTLYVLDACLSGLAGVQRKAADRTLTLAQLNRPSRQMITAGSASDESLVVDKLGGSLFTWAFIEGASGKAARPASGVVSVEGDLLGYVRDVVADEKALAGMAEHPLTPQIAQLQVNAGDFYFMSSAAHADLRAPANATPVRAQGVTVKGSDAQAPTRQVARGLLPRLGGAAVFSPFLNATFLVDANMPARYTLGVPNIAADGRMQWAEAKAWIARLDECRYLGYGDWRLPVAMAINESDLRGGNPANPASAYDGSSDFGPNVGAPGTEHYGEVKSELPHLFFNELGNESLVRPDGQRRAGRQFKAGTFVNLKRGQYWTGTEWYGNGVMDFDIDEGTQYAHTKDNMMRVLVARSGDSAQARPAGGTRPGCPSD